VLNPVIAAITLRATIGRRTMSLLAVAPVILIGVTVLLRVTHSPSRTWPDLVLGQLGFTVLLPLTALIIGASVLGSEIEDGSIIAVLATPVSRTAVIGAKFTVSAGLTIAFAAVPELIAGLIAPSGARLAVGLLAGALAASVIYSAIFVMASALTGRAIAAGLLYVLLWEGLLTNYVSGARVLSAGHYALGIANAIAPDPNLHASLGLPASLVLGAIVTAGSLGIAARRLSSFAISGEAG
jgi:ABC-2 type transport system permease protein